MNTHTETFAAQPSALRFMLRAVRPTPRWRGMRGLPDLHMIWKGLRVEAGAMESLQHSAGKEHPLAQDSISLLLPHVIGFRLLMAMLTHPQWPLPIWRALQVRNRLLLHRPLVAGEGFDLDARVAGWRVLEKGLEVDLHARLQQGGRCAWESVVTFYYRGRYGPASEHGAALGAAPVAPVVDERSEESVRWRVDGASRWHFAALTGDYNGIHQWDWYARRLGFRAAFAHPQRIAAQCLARFSSAAAAPLQLDLWIKGPVYFGGETTLRHAARAEGEGTDFALWIAGDARPALVGSQRRLPPEPRP